MPDDHPLKPSDPPFRRQTQPGAALIHLGMSGSLRVLDGSVPVRAHDHVDIELDDGRLLRFNDPRRFGCLLWQPAEHVHELLQALGPEPLDDDFDGDYLFARSRGRTAPVKALLLPALTTSARARPRGRRWRQSSTSGDGQREVVVTPATAVPGLNSTSSTSARVHGL